MVRPVSPDTDFKVALRVTGKYRYAATQPHIRDERSGKTIRRYVYWGEVSEDLRFIPNSRFLAASESKRKRLIFPSAWDLSAVPSLSRNLPEIPAIAAPYPGKDGSPCTGAVSVSPAREQSDNRLYGGPWFLWQIAAKKQVVPDLLKVFRDQRGMVADIMTLAMFLILTGYPLSMIVCWQRYTRPLSENSLTPACITRLLQRITDEERRRFLSLRLARDEGGERSKEGRIEGSKTLVACVFGTPSASPGLPADITWNRRRDDHELPPLPEQNPPLLAVYSLRSREPVYYRTLDGKEDDAGEMTGSDAGIPRAAANELRALTGGALRVIFAGSSASPDDIAVMVLKERSFLAGCWVIWEPVYRNVCRIKFDSQGMPLEMTYSAEYGIYTAQCDTPWTVPGAPEDSATTKIANLTVNLFLDMKERIRMLTLINEEIKKEAQIAGEKNGTPGTQEQLTALAVKLRYCNVKLSRNRLLVISLNEKAINKTKAIAGFSAAVSGNVPGDALSQYRLYALISEQEKQFAAMKDRLEGDTSGARPEYDIEDIWPEYDIEDIWPEEGETGGKTGRLFILFLALIMLREIQAVWEQKLRAKYPSPMADVHEMFPVRFTEHADGSAHITGFTASQAEICQAFSLPVPEECRSRHQKAETGTAAAARKPGRPKGSLNRKQVRGML